MLPRKGTGPLGGGGGGGGSIHSDLSTCPCSKVLRGWFLHGVYRKFQPKRQLFFFLHHCPEKGFERSGWKPASPEVGAPTRGGGGGGT